VIPFRSNNRRLSGIFRRAPLCRMGRDPANPFDSARTPCCLAAVFVGAILFLSAGWPCLFAADTNAPAASTIDGTWRWTFTMPDGTTSQPMLVLETAQGVLADTSFRRGSEALSRSRAPGKPGALRRRSGIVMAGRLSHLLRCSERKVFSRHDRF